MVKPAATDPKRPTRRTDAKWERTKILGICRRQGSGKFRAMGAWRRLDKNHRKPPGELQRYLGCADTLEGAIQLLKHNGVEVVQEKARREKEEVYAEKLAMYIDFVKYSNFEPADCVVHKEFRMTIPYFARSAPCAYNWAIEGKEKPWWKALLESLADLTCAEREQLLSLTSDVRAEWLGASRIQHKMLRCAYHRMANEYRACRGWWAGEVNYLVGSHMGWLGKGLARGVLTKCKPNEHPAGALALGESGHHYVFNEWTEALATIYKLMARKTSLLLSLPTPMNFNMYAQNSKRILRLDKCYHDLWYMRAIGEAERYTVNGCALPLPMDDGVTVYRYAQVFPDMSGHLRALGRHFKERRVMHLMRLAGCATRDPACFSMDCCFTGYLHPLDVEDMRMVEQRHLAQALAEHANERYHGHPLRIWRSAVAMAHREANASVFFKQNSLPTK